MPRLISRAAGLGSVEGIGEELLHGGVVEDDATQDGGVPQVVASADVVKHAGEPALRDLASIYDGAAEIDQKRLGDGRVKVVDEFGSVGEVKLKNRHEPRQGKADEESDAGPSHVGAVELGVPRHDHPPNTQNSSEAHVHPSADRVAVESGVFGGHDGGGNEQRDAGVVHASKHGDGVDIGNGAHRVPNGGAYQRQAGHHEEDGGNNNVRLGAEVEIGTAGVKVKGDGQHQDQAQGMRPNVDEFVGHVENGPDAFYLGLAETVASLDVWIVSPRRWQLVV